MIIPVRCYSCNKIIANKWEDFKCKIQEGLTHEESFKLVGLKRYCCKRMFLGHIDLIDKLLFFSEKNYKN
jgi:DNA-directed RNA polymerase I, II, and III subunit RPABC5